MAQFVVYILASKRNGVLYVGVTGNIAHRVHTHREVRGFTSRYGVTRLVHFEVFDDPHEAIAREKRVKRWRRAWKIALIETNNPDWRDLYPQLFS